jgi:hypothetical protein
MPRRRSRAKSERHAELGRRSIEGRQRDARGHFLPRDPGVTPPVAPEPPPAPTTLPTPDPTPPARRSWFRRVGRR